MSERRVVCATNKYNRFLLLGARHWDAAMHQTAEIVGTTWLAMMREEFGEEQGFIDQHGVFMTRIEAWHVAYEAGQILYRCGGDTANGGTLYSENLY